MRKFSVFIVGFLCALLASQGLAQRKLAQTGMKFLNVATDARITGMGEAFTAAEGYSSSMFYNPAGMARQKVYMDVALGQTQWIADINYQFGSVAVRPFDGDYGVLGFTFMAVDYGDLYETIPANNAEGFLELGKFSPTGSAIGLGYAYAFSDKFSVGGNVKLVSQFLGNARVGYDAAGGQIRRDSKQNVAAFDLGVLYRTGFRSLNFGMAVRNFSKEVKYEKEDFQLPLVFKIGLSMNAMDFFDINQEVHSFLVTVDATHPRDYPEQWKVGGEYLFMQILALRAGFISKLDVDDYGGFIGGVGVQKTFYDMRVAIDYSYTPFKAFSPIHRISFQFSY